MRPAYPTTAASSPAALHISVNHGGRCASLKRLRHMIVAVDSGRATRRNRSPGYSVRESTLQPDPDSPYRRRSLTATNLTIEGQCSPVLAEYPNPAAILAGLFRDRRNRWSCPSEPDKSRGLFPPAAPHLRPWPRFNGARAMASHGRARQRAACRTAECPPAHRS